MTRNEIKNHLEEDLSVWESLNETEKEALIDNAEFVRYKKGANVHGQESSCIGTLLIDEGSLRVYMLSEEGKEITLYRLQKGDLCVMSASCVIANIDFDVLIDAEQDTKAIMINSATISRLMKSNIYYECFVYKIATERFSDVMWAMQQILFSSIDVRLARFLWDESLREAKDRISLTHEQIAKYIGSAREVVSRMLKYFESEGVVELHRGGLSIVDRQKLKQMTK